MDREFTDFFIAGRNLRMQQKTGTILFVKPGHCMKKIIQHCLHVDSIPLITCNSVESAMEHLPLLPKCIVLDLDEMVGLDVVPFLQTVDKESPCTISVALSSNQQCANEILNSIPRVTAIVKGDGFEDLLLQMIPEWEREMACR
jgi:hypothetical protein